MGEGAGEVFLILFYGYSNFLIVKVILEIYADFSLISFYFKVLFLWVLKIKIVNRFSGAALYKR